MSSSRIQPPSVNLKERIAALQQRNVSPSQRPVTTNAASVSTVASSGSGLRDKIAKFERKGGVPVPRGSFGLGAPPPSDNPQLRKKGELYGNRIPGSLRVTSGGPPLSRSSSPLSFTASPRSVSLSSINIEDTTPRASPVTPTIDIDPLPLDTNIASLDTAFDAELSVPNGSDSVGVPEELDDHEDISSGSCETSVPLSIIVSSDDPIPTSAYPGDDTALANSQPNDELFSPVCQEDIPSDSDTGVVGIHAVTPAVPIEEPLDLQAAPSDDSQEPFTQDIGGQPPESFEPSVSDDDNASHHRFSDEDSHEDVCSIENSLSGHEPSQQIIESQVIHDDEPPTPTPAHEQFDSIVEPNAPAAVEIIITEEPESEALNHISPDDSAPESPVVVISDSGDDSASVAEPEPEPPSALSGEPAESQAILLDQPIVAIESGEPAEPQVILLDQPTVVVESEASSRPPDSPLARLAYDIPESTTSSPTTDLVALPSPGSRPNLDSSTLTIVTNPRPLSMIETNASPSHVTLAHRITPVTSRGRPVFLPAPPPATSEDQEEREFGSVSLHKASHSFSHPQTYHSHYSDPDLIVTNSDSTFSAVVHGKIRDSSSLARASSAYPVTPQISRVKQSAAPEVPPSPVAYGDLAALLEEAALLEKTLSNGELPSETDHHHHHIVQAEPDTTPSPVIEIVEEPPVQPAAPVRSRSFFRNPLTRNESTTRTEPPTREAHTRASRSGFVTPPNISESPAQHITVSAPMLDNGSTVTVNIENDVPPTPPPKSPRPRYLSGLRRLASSSRSSHTMPGAYPRNSISTSSEISSEDSMPIITPSEHSLESPGSTSEFGRRSSHGSHVPWPSVSPKKSGGSISRAASFAEKIWHRARTKSAASTVSRAEIADRLAAESMVEAMPLYHPMMPSNAIPETLEPDQNQRVIIPPLRSTSLHHTSPKTPPHVSPVSAAPSPHANTPFISPNSHPPGSRDTLIPSLMADRPTSWVSVSSTGSSLASPLFDKELFDAFPGVPQIIPSVPTGHYRNKSRPSLPIPSFDSLPSPLSLQSSGAQSSASTDLRTHPALIPHGTKSLGRASTSPWLRTSTEATR